MFFNLAQERRISAAELDDYNHAAANAFEALEEIKLQMKKANESKNAAIKGMEKKIDIEKKLVAILEIIGMKSDGINVLLNYPLRFLSAIKSSVKKHQTPIMNENYFLLIDQKYRWLNTMIERDRQNIKTISAQAKLYQSRNDKAKEMAEMIMHEIAEESNHIIDGLRALKSFSELQQQIENHWYEQISANNIAE
ncbi:hypothetical protein [uncultured Draconibacterium sp.]|uniref:hypothetical protein n=1 Tax=uncultured Draconibacterium sp. TaxID=1573823 RepID=UPI0025D1F0C0|nr:hypothetical protein [uncultured Draconibacterium sp.]